MITEKEANQLMNKFIELRSKKQEFPNDKKIKFEFQKHEQLCIEKFKYLISMRTSRYKAFSNYDDLNQEGLEALVKAMKTFNPKKGSFFAWAHNYIATKVVRGANTHSTIRYPLRIAKEQMPHKEAVMPLLLEEKNIPDQEVELDQLMNSVHNVLHILTPEQHNIISLFYGLNGEPPISINKICEKLDISRASCIKTMQTGLSLIRENIKI